MIKASSLTVRKAVETLYVPGTPGMAPRTVRKLRHQCNMWERFTSNPPIDKITKADFVAFRTAALEANLSATYIETTISDVLTVLRFAAEADVIAAVPMPGRRLKRRPRLKHTPSIEDLAAVYQQCHLPRWPNRQARSRHTGLFITSRVIPKKPDWWRGLLATCFFTGLRRDDVLTLRWDEVRDDRIVRVMRKTHFTVELPLHPVLKKHLAKVEREGEQIFGRPNSLHQLREWFRKMSEAAGVKPAIGFQSLRRLSAQEWEQARPGCGTLILGHNFGGADRFYLNPFRALQDALPTLRVPEGMEIIRTISTDKANNGGAVLPWEPLTIDCSM